MSKEMKAALVGGFFAIVAAIIGGLFVIHNTASVQSNNSQSSQTISSTSTTIQSNSSANFPPVATQAAQPTYPDIRGTYSGQEQNSSTGSSGSFTLTITQQNQQSFQGTLTGTSVTLSGSSPINGTVDQNGDIQFTMTALDNNNNQMTETYTGFAQSGGGWNGTYSVSNGYQGTWYAN
jgi:hypothetical protein